MRILYKFVSSKIGQVENSFVILCQMRFQRANAVEITYTGAAKTGTWFITIGERVCIEKVIQTTIKFVISILEGDFSRKSPNGIS